MTELAVEAVEERLQASEWSGLSLAVVNTPSSTVISGDEASGGALACSSSVSEGVFCRQVAV